MFAWMRGLVPRVNDGAHVRVFQRDQREVDAASGSLECVALASVSMLQVVADLEHRSWAARHEQ
jgi:hypothetical protein